MSLVMPADHHTTRVYVERMKSDKEGGRRSEVEVLLALALACLHLP